MYKALALAVLLIAPAHAQTAQEIVAAADAVRNPEKPFRIVATVIAYKSGTAVDRNVFAVLSKLDPATRQFRDVMLYTDPPRDAGKILLLNGSNLWFYDPASRQSVRMSPQERLSGQASAGDVLTENIATDYTAAADGTETIPDANRRQRVCWHLELKAAKTSATYNRIEYWVEQKTFYPIKARFFADSGAPLKTLYYRNFVRIDDRMAPAQAVIVDAVDPSLVTTVDLGMPQFEDVPDLWFERDYLPHLKTQ
jgi:outer membrane lipoprotein-sorting protein